MKNIMNFFIMAALLLIVSAQSMSAQDLKQVTNIPENETNEERKIREKRLEQLRDSIAFIEANMAIDSSYFVITANRILLNGRINIMAPESSTNFILVQGDHAIIQLATNKGFSGLNGLGGITVEGSVNNRKKEIAKNGNIYYTFSVNGTAISAQISITVYKNSNQSMVFVNPNFNSNDMTVYGPLIPYDHQNGDRFGKHVYKGKSIP